ncbi:hypothetical protein FIBSPDRAFT_532018 [Athelia psychrophila]|uniref:Secreted protein n=1 Tax=Athelia psychrophila TaxID=1759441 RepID=A0A167TI01_9AGAM|nr:hypothetical protein FIBSPDRAFT_532018 [Fibularhizoctonia sp. CBS 109695]
MLKFLRAFLYLLPSDLTSIQPLALPLLTGDETLRQCRCCAVNPSAGPGERSRTIMFAGEFPNPANCWSTSGLSSRLVMGFLISTVAPPLVCIATRPASNHFISVFALILHARNCVGTLHLMRIYSMCAEHAQNTQKPQLQASTRQ